MRKLIELIMELVQDVRAGRRMRLENRRRMIAEMPHHVNCRCWVAPLPACDPVTQAPAHPIVDEPMGEGE